MRGRHRKRSDSSIRLAVILVLILSATALLLPRSWTQGLTGLAQALLPFQDAVSSSTDAIVGEPSAHGASPDEESAELARAKQAAEHRAAAFSIRVRQLEDEVKLLTATRLWDVAGRRIGAKGRLIPARVISDDLLPWRSSRLINAGGSLGVSRGDPVISRAFTVDTGEGDAAPSGYSVVLGESLVGSIEHAAGRTARVKLLTDPESGVKVRVGRVIDQTFAGPDRYFWLIGRGPGRMEVQDAEVRDVQAGLIRVGDLVLSDPENELLPAAMVIGRVERIDENREKPLFAVLLVSSAVDERALRRVYVYDPGSEE